MLSYFDLMRAVNNKLIATMSEVNTPLYDITIDVSTEETLYQGCIEVLSQVRSSWQSFEVQLKVFTDGDKADLVLIYVEDLDKYVQVQEHEEDGASQVW